jgi:hypothetical protein
MVVLLNSPSWRSEIIDKDRSDGYKNKEMSHPKHKYSRCPLGLPFDRHAFHSFYPSTYPRSLEAV